MALELGVWRIDGSPRPVEFGSLDLEERLEEILEHEIGMASPAWMVIGRQVHTDHGGFIDLLAIDADANLVVLELKRYKTPRDVVAQLLDYASWVRHLEIERIAQIFSEYQKERHPGVSTSFDEAFQRRFGVALPEDVNGSHELVIVAATLDSATERIVRYLADCHGISINAIFFRAFRDNDRQYLGRAWLRDPSDEMVRDERISSAEWNGEYYASFGYSPEVVRDGIRWGYIAAGGGSWYSKTLALLEPGARVWVNIPGEGYVGVAEVLEGMQPVEDVVVTEEGGDCVPLVEVSPEAAKLRRATTDPETADYLVRVRWLRSVDPKEPIRERGLFGNQNSVARPRTPKWSHTVERLKERFGVS